MVEYNINQVAEEMDITPEVLREILDLFFEHIDEYMAQLEKEIKNNSLEEIAKSAHKIAGSGGAVQFELVRKLAKEIENSAREKKIIDYKEKFNQLKEMIALYKNLL